MRRRRQPASTSHERWLVSYADFITLLFAFFTTMYAISNVDSGKLEEAASSMQAAFSAPGQGTPASAQVGALDYDGGRSMLTEPGTSGKVLEALTDVRARLDGRLSQQVAAGVVDLSMDPRGLVVSMQEAGSFSTGSAELSDSARTILNEIGATLLGIDNFVRVEGHTDDVPIETARFRSNWDLSTSRATAVVRFLSEEVSLPATRLSASGYGEFRPRVPNTSPENRSINRRVDLIILNPATSAAEEPRMMTP